MDLDYESISFEYPYGTPEYVKEYAERYYDNVRLIKLVNGEMIIGFVHSYYHSNSISIDFPFSIEKDNTHGFLMYEYTPELKLKTIEIGNVNVLFVSELGESKVQNYISVLHEQWKSDEDIKEDALRNYLESLEIGERQFH